MEFKGYKSEEGKFIYQFDTFNEDDALSLPDKEKGESKAIRSIRRERKAKCDTIIVPAQEDGFNRVCIGENQWYAIRIGAAMRARIKYIAAYQVVPISAITHIAEIKEIVPHKDTGKFLVTFKGPAKEIKPIPIKESKNSSQGPIYAEFENLIKAKSVEEASKVAS